MDKGCKLLSILEQYLLMANNSNGNENIVNTQIVDKVPATTSVEHIVPKYVACASRLAFEQSFVPLNALTAKIIQHSCAKKVVVCGWDREKLSSMREWFFSEVADIDVIDFSNDVPLVPVHDTVCAFCLVNAEQTGSFKGKLLGDTKARKWLDSIKANGRIVWVMDSVREHISEGGGEDTIVEAFAEMMNLVEQSMCGDKAFEVMACDRDLYWTVLLHEIYFNERIFESENARQNFVNDMAELFHLSNECRHATGRYVTQFKQMRK
jgi:hypothetical protein